MKRNIVRGDWFLEVLSGAQGWPISFIKEVGEMFVLKIIT